MTQIILSHTAGVKRAVIETYLPIIMDPNPGLLVAKTSVVYNERTTHQKTVRDHQGQYIFPLEPFCPISYEIKKEIG